MHSFIVLDRVAVLLELEVRGVSIELKEEPHPVRNLGSLFQVARILQPDLNPSLLRGKFYANYERVGELLANHCEGQGFPNCVDIVLVGHDDPDAALRRLFPHRYLAIAEQK